MLRQATSEDRFVSLSHGAEDDEDVKVPRELDKLIAQFNSEVSDTYTPIGIHKSTDIYSP